MTVRHLGSREETQTVEDNKTMRQFVQLAVICALALAVGQPVSGSGTVASPAALKKNIVFIVSDVSKHCGCQKNFLLFRLWPHAHTGIFSRPHHCCYRILALTTWDFMGQHKYQPQILTRSPKKVSLSTTTTCSRCAHQHDRPLCRGAM